ncbi:MAG: hypothetical protein JXQ72_01245 [Anaerolineae bacterium]|nr:hypothetical protein [Anaerolineae bacterium]
MRAQVYHLPVLLQPHFDDEQRISGARWGCVMGGAIGCVAAVCQPSVYQ